MKVLIAGAGGAPSEGVINSLLRCDKNDEVIGMGSEPTDLVLSAAQTKYFIPYANTQEYEPALMKLLSKEKPHLIHFQNDLEIYYASLLREKIQESGTKIFMPTHDVIDTCVHKYKTYLKLKEYGVKVPETTLVNNENDLKAAMQSLGNKKGTVWLRSTLIGGGGKGAAPTNNFEFAKGWIDRYSGWGDFSVSTLLSPDTVTFLSIWYEGELIVAQTRIRKGWTHGNRTISGVTGVTKVGQTFSDPLVTDISLQTIHAIDKKPHGIYGVDMTYDFDGTPNPTEINISRFFTTVLFFTEAGLNMPKIFKDIILYNEFPKLSKNINPLPDGLLWLRGMDIKPKLFTDQGIEKEILIP
jgi:predicted ATP-grasp superfamily ATP-dependent carboligase